MTEWPDFMMGIIFGGIGFFFVILFYSWIFKGYSLVVNWVLDRFKRLFQWIRSRKDSR